MKKEKALAKEIRLTGMTQKEIAKKIGVSEVTVSNWINGNAVISPVCVRKLTEVGIPKQAIREPSREVWHEVWI